MRTTVNTKQCSDRANRTSHNLDISDISVGDPLYTKPVDNDTVCVSSTEYLNSSDQDIVFNGVIYGMTIVCTEEVDRNIICHVMMKYIDIGQVKLNKEFTRRQHGITTIGRTLAYPGKNDNTRISYRAVIINYDDVTGIATLF